MSSICLTDHGNLCGAINFYKACKKVGVNPIIGCEAYISEDIDGLDKPEMTKDNHHIILLASNAIGLKNLYWLVSNAHINNFYHKGRIHIKNLEDRSEGLYATSACLDGVLGKLAMFDQGSHRIETGLENISKRAQYLKEIFKDRFYLEIQDGPQHWEQTAYNKLLLHVGKKYKIPTVISADAHYLRKDDLEAHTFIMAMSIGKSIGEYKGLGDAGIRMYEGCYVRSPQEMLEAAKRYDSEESFHNTLEIGAGCNIEMELGNYEMPNFDITKTEDYNEFKTWKSSSSELIGTYQPDEQSEEAN